MGIRWTDSTAKHGVAQEDALHAIANAVYVEEEFDEPRVPGRARPWLFIGPARGAAAVLLEVMVEVFPPRDMVVFHAMPARQKHLRRIAERSDGDEGS